MNERGLASNRSVRRAGVAVLVSLVLSAGATKPARALDRPRTDSRAAPAEVRPAAASDINPESKVRYDGTPVPGARLSLRLEGQESPGATYRWEQVEGPAVALDDGNGPRLDLTVPPDARTLGFLLTIRDANGLRTSRVTIPILPAPDRPASAARGLRADAGDEQVGLIGRRITLNGSRSMPRVGVAYRWFLLSGPKVEQASQDGYYYSFTPTASGVYRFGLVVATAESNKVAISEVDQVTVRVGEMPSSVATAAAPGTSTAAIDQILRGPGAAAGRVTIEQAAGVFETISARASLYTTFAELSSELMRRLDTVIPTDPDWRQFWSQGVFAPLTQHLISEMHATGLDLRYPGSHQQGLGTLQQDRLQKFFASYAREFRARAQNRPTL
jgi:hypothetical protein